jgi:hypothetical protein
MGNNIDSLITDSLAAVQAHPDHWLLPLRRRQIYGVLDPDQSALPHTRTRAWLECLTARYVLPLWGAIRADPIQVWAEDYDVPKTMVDLADATLRGTTDQANARQYLEQQAEVAAFSGELESSRFYHAWCVYQAALAALRYDLGTDSFASANITPATTSLRGYGADAANWAALSFAGGEWVSDANGPKDDYRSERGDWNNDMQEVRKRRSEFWHWWLTVAIPEAQRLAQTYQP